MTLPTVTTPVLAAFDLSGDPVRLVRVNRVPGHWSLWLVIAGDETTVFDDEAEAVIAWEQARCS